MSSKSHRDIPAAEIEWRPGASSGVRYARFPLDEANPRAPVPAHTHGCNYFEYIIEGEQAVGKVRFRKGDVRLVTGGTGYGPIKVGPEGCTVLIVFEDGSRSVTETLPRRS
jgi:anti-sigma factor ChrR (cupin superfamily)